MKESYIRTNENGGQSLIVFYDNALGDFNERIAEARLKFDSEKDKRLPVICMPEIISKLLDR